jgi:lipopolysaccharide transport system permease protein
VRPLIGAFGATFLFSRVLGVEPGSGIPYLLFVMVGQATWTLLDLGLLLATRSLDATRSLRRMIPLSRRAAVVAYLFPAALEVAVVGGIIVALTMWYGFHDGSWFVTPGLHNLLIPAGLALVLLLAFGLGSFTSVLGEGNRDTRWTLRYVVSPWTFVTPIMYPVAVMPEHLRWTLPLNPAALPVLLVREGLFGDAGITSSIVVGGLIGTLVIATLGATFLHFRGRRSDEDG